MSNSSITYEDIHGLLTGLGFSYEVHSTERNATGEPPKQHVVYRHEKKDTVLKFPSKESVPCLKGELISLRVHLVGRGHLDEDAIDVFIETGRLPVLR